MRKYINLLFAILVGIAPLKAAAQITIAPTNVFTSPQKPFDSYLVINGSDQPQEISISFVFGYTIADSAGMRRLVYDDSVRAKEYSAAGWVNAFPRNFTLTPGQRQTVRLRVRPSNPGTLKDGLYWARIKTLAVPLSQPVEATANDKVSASINFRLEQVTGLYYKVGAPKTGIEINNMTTKLADNGQLEILADLNRTGDAPYIGTIYFDILDQNNKTLRSASLSTTIYFSETLSQAMSIDGLKPGSYKAQIRFTNKRSDISQENLVQMDPASKMTSFRIE